MRNLNVTHQISTILGDDVVWNTEKVENSCTFQIIKLCKISNEKH